MGGRSAKAAQALVEAGYKRVASVEGGTRRWRDDALPLVQPSDVDLDSHERYARHLSLPEVGQAAHRRLQAARGARGMGGAAGRERGWRSGEVSGEGGV